MHAFHAADPIIRDAILDIARENGWKVPYTSKPYLLWIMLNDSSIDVCDASMYLDAEIITDLGKFVKLLKSNLKRIGRIGNMDVMLHKDGVYIDDYQLFDKDLDEIYKECCKHSDYPVVLRLSDYQASVLRDACRHIGGSINGPRGVFQGLPDSIANQLVGQNVQQKEYIKCDESDTIHYL